MGLAGVHRGTFVGNLLGAEDEPDEGYYLDDLPTLMLDQDCPDGEAESLLLTDEGAFSIRADFCRDQREDSTLSQVYE